MILLGASLMVMAGCGLDLFDSSVDTSLDFAFNLPQPPTAAETAGEPVFMREVIVANELPEGGVHGPSIAALPDGTLMAAWYAYDGPSELTGARIMRTTRPVGSDTWPSPTVHVDTTWADANPVLFQAHDAIWLLHSVVVGSGWALSHIEIQQSCDAGVTWSSPATISSPRIAVCKYQPVRLADGSYLLPAYDDLLRRALFYASADGVTWQLRSRLWTGLREQTTQPAIACTSSGRVLAVMRNNGGASLWVTASDDGGRTWASPRDSGFPNPGSPSVIKQLASGNLLLVFNNSPLLRRPLSVALSADDGVTWLPPKAVADGPGEYAYPAVTQTPDGLLHIAYSHSREQVDHITLNEAWILSADAAPLLPDIRTQDSERF